MPPESAPTAAAFDRLVAHGALFETILDALPLAVAVFQQGQGLVWANARYCELTNLELSTAQALDIYDAFPNALADLTDQIDAALRGDRPRAVRVPFQHRLGAAGGGARYVEASFIPLTGSAPDGGGARRILFIGGDVTEREQLREDLARSVTQLESTFDIIPDAVRVFDTDGNILRLNTQALQDHALGAPGTLRELWQHDRPRTLDGTVLFMHEHPVARALRGERVRGETLAVRRRTDGASTVIEVNSNPLRDVQGRIRGAVSVERDVTERTRLAQQLEEQVRRSAVLYERVSTEAERLERMVAERTEEVLQLQEARSRERRLAAIGQLAAGVMHDVNNALNPIMAAAYLLEARAADPEAVKDYAARIAKAAETGAATAARVGRFIRQEPLAQPDQIVDLGQMADEVIAMTRPMWAERARGGRVQLEQAVQGKAPIRGIAGEIREALLNLVQNALDAMPGNGTLGIIVFRSGDDACIEVTDTGVGMTAEVRERAFEPFFTTKGAGGTGLGLAEVYGIVRRHRGRAEIDSTPGVGTRVRLRFPLATDAAAPEPAPARKPSTRRILVVEDNDDGRDFMRALLETGGHHVTAVAGVSAALELLTREGDAPPFDVLITDIGLPDGSGWDLVSATRTRWPAMRIGVVTGWEPRLGAGPEANFILRKPVRAEDLLGRVAADD